MSAESYRRLLTPSGVSVLMKTNKELGHTPPPIVVQVIHIKAIPSPKGDRFRIVLSDGDHFVQGTMATQLNDLVLEQRLQPHGFIRITDFMNNQVQGKRIIILLAADVLPERAQDRVGTPVTYDESHGAVSPVASSSAQPLYNSTNKNNYGAGANPAVKPKQYGSSAPMNMSPAASNPYGGGGSRHMPQMGSAPVVRSSTATITPYTTISDLNLYQSRWTIQARVSHKSEVRTWSNAKGEGLLFSVDLVDNSGVDIRATFFEEVVDRYFSMLQENQVYSFSGGRLKVANARWNSCKSPYEISFGQNAEIHICSEATVQDAPYDFVPNIASLESMVVEDEKQTTIDLLAFVQSVGEVNTIISKKQGKEFQKCEVTLIDDSQCQVAMTLWGEQAYNAAWLYPVGELVAIRRVRLTGFGGGKTLSGPRQVARAVEDPSVTRSPAFGRLQEWHARTGGHVTGRSLSGSGGFGGPTPLAERKCVADIKREHLGYQNDKGDYLAVHGTLSFPKKDKEGGAWYPACPNDKEPCRSRCKVTPTATGAGEESWSCQSCNCTYPNCVRRWIFSGVVEDTSGSTLVTFFDDAGFQLLGATADEVYQASEGNIPSDAYDSTFAKAAYTEWLFKLRCKLEPGQDGGYARVKASVQSLHPVDYVQESKDLLVAIAQF